jgi:hypothetical protein
MSLYLADVPYDDQNMTKYRPALIVIPKINDSAYTGVLKFTSKYNEKSNQIKEFYYPIEEWQRAGLKQPYYIDIHHVYRIPTRQFKK